MWLVAYTVRKQVVKLTTENLHRVFPIGFKKEKVTLYFNQSLVSKKKSNPQEMYNATYVWFYYDKTHANAQKHTHSSVLI